MAFDFEVTFDIDQPTIEAEFTLYGGSGTVYKFQDGLKEENNVVSLKKASKTKFGGVVIGDNIDVDDNAKISIPSSTTTTYGVVKFALNEDIQAGTAENLVVHPKHLSMTVTAEKVRAQAAEATLTFNLASEIARAKAAEQALQSSITSINSLIPEEATILNKLADKNYVNNKIFSSGAFRGIFNSLEELRAVESPQNCDYGFVKSTDIANNTIYSRYIYKETALNWIFEYAVSNNTFTTSQWAAINSGMTGSLAQHMTIYEVI